MSTKIKSGAFPFPAGLLPVLCAGCSRKEETAKEENPKIREQMALAESIWASRSLMRPSRRFLRQWSWIRRMWTSI